MHDGIAQLFADAEQPTEEMKPQTSEAATIEEKSGAGSPVPQKEPEPEHEVSAEMVEAGADLAIGLFDISQSSIFRLLVKRKKNKRIIKLWGESGLNKMERLIDEMDAANNTRVSFTDAREFNPEELAMIRLAKKVDEMVEDLPMSEDEKNLIKVPLMEIMKKKGSTLPPEYALILGVLQIAGARAAEMAMM